MVLLEEYKVISKNTTMILDKLNVNKQLISETLDKKISSGLKDNFLFQDMILKYDNDRTIQEVV